MQQHKLKSVLPTPAAMIGVEPPARRVVIKETLAHPAVAQAVQNAAQKRAISVGQSWRIARSYAREIAARFSPTFARLMRPVLRRLWERVYDRVTLHHGDNLSEVIAGHTPVYLPCHRSHLDYLLLPYLLHERGLAVPHAAAGDNLNIPLMGRVLRWGGAFYIRRSFRGNRLYGTVFQSYTAALLRWGVALEYFIEGGRSRTGLVLKPRLGLLDMTLRAGLAYPERPLVLIPVFFAYESVAESKTYLAELGGKPKQRESLGTLWGGIHELRKPRGEVHVNIGQPLYLSALLDSLYPDWRSQPLESPLLNRPEWLQSVNRQIARQIVTEINNAAVVTPMGLLACVVLDRPDTVLDTATVIMRFNALQQLLHRWRYSARCVVTTQDAEASIAQACRLELLHRPDTQHLAATEEQQGVLEYHRNTLRHVLALPGAIASSLDGTTACSTEAVVEGVAERYPALSNALFLPWKREDLPQAVAALLPVMAEGGWLSTSDSGWQLNPEYQPMGALLAGLVRTATSAEAAESDDME